MSILYKALERARAERQQDDESFAAGEVTTPKPSRLGAAPRPIPASHPLVQKYQVRREKRTNLSSTFAIAIASGATISAACAALFVIDPLHIFPKPSTVRTASISETPSVQENQRAAQTGALIDLPKLANTDKAFQEPPVILPSGTSASSGVTETTKPLTDTKISVSHTATPKTDMSPLAKASTPKPVNSELSPGAATEPPPNGSIAEPRTTAAPASVAQTPTVTPPSHSAAALEKSQAPSPQAATGTLTVATTETRVHRSSLSSTEPSNGPSSTPDAQPSDAKTQPTPSITQQASRRTAPNVDTSLNSQTTQASQVGTQPKENSTRRNGIASTQNLGTPTEPGTQNSTVSTPAALALQYRRAAAAMSAGSAVEAEKIYSQILASNPQDLDALRGLAASYDMQGNFRSSIKTYKEILSLDPFSSPAISGLITAIATEDSNQSTQELNSLTKTYPRVPELWAALASAYETQGDIKLAIAAEKKAVSLSKANVLYTYNLAVMQDQIGDAQGAMDNYANTLQDIQNNGNTHNLPVEAIMRRLNYLAGR